MRVWRITGAGAFSTGYIQRLYFAQNVSALSDKMLMVKAELFQKTGGFDRTLTLHYAAIDFCLKLREQGLVNIVNPYGGIRIIIPICHWMFRG